MKPHDFYDLMNGTYMASAEPIVRGPSPITGDVLKAMEAMLSLRRNIPVAFIIHMKHATTLRRHAVRGQRDATDMSGMPVYWFIFERDLPEIVARFAGRRVVVWWPNGKPEEIPADVVLGVAADRLTY